MDFIAKVKFANTKESEISKFRKKLGEIENLKDLKCYSDEYIDISYQSKKPNVLIKTDNFLCIAELMHEDRQEVKKLLKEKNLRNLTDSELLLKFYTQFSESGMSKLSKEFTLIIYDYKLNKLLVFRDHIGFRNIYYIWKGENILLSSSFKTLTKLEKDKFSINIKKLKDFISLNDKCMQSTFFSEVLKIPPASFLIANSNKSHVKKYSKLFLIDKKLKDSEYIKKLGFLLEKSVMDNRANNNKKIGFLFSGGLDSSTIISIFNNQKANDQELYGYSAHFSDFTQNAKKQIDEKIYQKIIFSSSSINDRSFSGTSLSTLSELDFYLNIIGQPFFFPNLYISNEGFRKANYDGVKIVFNGNDGDSVISHGYEYLYELFLKLRWVKLYDEIKKISHLRKKSKIFIFKRTILDQIWLKKFSFDSRKVHKKIVSSPIHSNAIEVQRLIARYYSINEIYPFYDKEFMNFCINVPGNLKISEGYSRFILRQAMKKIVPDEIRLRTDKSNLAHALTESFCNKDKDLIEEHLNNPAKTIKKAIDINEMQNIWEQIKKNPRSFATRSKKPSKIFAYIVLNRWLQLNHEIIAND